MAGVVKGVAQVVSSRAVGDGSQCDAFGTDRDNFAFAAHNTNNDLLARSPSPAEDDLSLQDLIDSELALRVASTKSPAEADGTAAKSNGDLLVDLDSLKSNGDLDSHKSSGDLDSLKSNGDLDSRKSSGNLDSIKSNGDLNSIKNNADLLLDLDGHQSNGDLLLDLDNHQSNGDLLLDLDNHKEPEAVTVHASHEQDAFDDGEEGGFGSLSVNGGGLVSDFLEQERSHTEQVDDSLSLSLSSSNADMAPLCSGEGDDLDAEMSSELGSEAPADSDFSPNHPLAEGGDGDDGPEQDEATLAEDLSMASDRSQERTGSLLDLDPLRPDSPPAPGPGLGSGTLGLGTGGTGAQEGEGRGHSSSPPLEQPDSGSAEESRARAVLSAAAAAGPEQPQQPPQPPQQLQREEAEQAQPTASIAVAAGTAIAAADPIVAVALDVDVPPVVSEHVDGLLEESAPDPALAAPCVDANRVGVSDNSMDGFATAAAGPGAVPSGEAPGDPAGQGFEDGFETWSTVEEAVGHSDHLAEAHADAQIEAKVELNAPPSTSSDTETVSETSEKKTVAKKKKTTTDGAESTKKKTKKNKKSEEKENISVLTNGHCLNGYAESKIDSVNNIPHSNGYADHTLVEDDLSNVCVKDLKSAYTSLTKSEAPKDSKDLKDIDHDIIYCGPIKNLKQTYCSEAVKDCNGIQSPVRKAIIATGISIRDLRRSFGDLRNCESSENEEHYHQDEDTSSEGKARSLGDLRRLARDLYRPDINNTTTCSRKPIHTGVSVKALRASYCSLINLDESSVSDCRGALSNSDFLLSSTMKSSFSKFDQLSKKTVLHVRSVDASKVQKQFNESSSTSPEAQSNCKACGKQVFVMEQIKAEKALWHKNCFRCKECSKQLTVDTYSSNEGDIYCKPHFRELFKPKAVVEDSAEPTSDKPDLGLEELSSLNVKSRFQVFEKSEENKSSEIEKSGSAVNVKRSASILSKLAKFQAKGMDIGVTDDSLNGIPYEESSTSSEEEEDEDENEENCDIVKSRRTARERPMSFSKMEDVKSRWETGSAAKKEERREERKQEIQSIRSRLFMGKQGKMKEMYEQAVKESEQPAARRGAEVRSEKAKSIKEKFERGETLVSDEDEEQDKKIKDEDLGVFEAGISKKSRSLFLELDASAAKTVQQNSSQRPAVPKEKNNKREVHLNHQISSEVVKASDKVEDVQVETADISSRFKFFETYKAPEKQKKTFRITPPREGQVKTESPEREVYRDPDVIRGDDPVEGDELQHSMTTSKMLSIFRQMEEKAQKEDVPDGPKPLKCFTPPPDYKPESGSSEDDRSDEDDEEDDEEEDEEEDDVHSSVKTEDEFLKAAKEAAKAKTLRAKFEHWEEQENNINNGGGNINPNLLESEHESIESTKSLRARFEALKSEAEAPKEKPRAKVNRFVEIQTSCAEYCDSCEKKVYPLEKVETGGKLFHKGCFRCMQCSCILRMESYTLNNGKLYCIPHFKQLFISKGNYDEGFGLDQHKRKWNSTRENGDILLNGIDANGNNH